MSDEQPHQDWPMIRSAGLHVDLMSNFDHEVDHDVAQRLQSEKVRASYAGWNFNAECWFESGEYYAAVYQYHVYQKTLHADTPEELMILVSNEFGYE